MYILLFDYQTFLQSEPIFKSLFSVAPAIETYHEKEVRQLLWSNFTMLRLTLLLT